jgi:hypothetical protein
MEEFKRIVADPTSTGAVLFAVARGKVRAVLCCALGAMIIWQSPWAYVAWRACR